MDEFRNIPTDGLHLAVEAFGIGPPLVFAPGLTDNRAYIRSQLAPLADRFRVITYDQRGHGGSTPVTDPALYGAQRMAGDLQAILDAFDIEQAVVGGESMGAATTLVFALRCPHRVEKLLLTGPAFGETPNPGRAQLKELGRTLAMHDVEELIAEAAAGEWEQMGLNDATRTTLAAMMRSHTPASVAVACEAVSDWTIDLSGLSRLQCPVQIIAWEDDPVHPVALARRMAGILPAARLTVLPPNARFNDLASIGRIYRDFLLG